MKAKIAWLVRSDPTDPWEFRDTEPERWQYHETKQIVYFEVE